MERPTPALMIQATGSNAGKSTIVAGLARALVRRGLKVAPFKPQNMSNNAAVAIEGGEIGRAQAVQARAARVPPSVHMNPVLLKPETDTGAQIIVQGKRWGTLRAKNYLDKKAALLPAVLESFAYLARDADIVLVEGAGSPAEINLRAGDIANMGFAAAADVPVVMLGDIDRGGVIASLAGTHLVLEPDELARIHGFIVNKFRGDVGLFGAGADGDHALHGLALARRRAVAAAGGMASGGGCRRSRSRAWFVVHACHCGAGSRAHRQFRRSRSAGDGARRQAGLRQAGRAYSCRSRNRHSPRQQIHHRRSRLLARAGLGHRHQGACTPRRPCARAVRRLSNARPNHRRSRRRRWPCRHGRRPGPARHHDRHDVRQIHHARQRHALRDRRGDQGLRDSSRPQRRWRLRAAAA